MHSENMRRECYKHENLRSFTSTQTANKNSCFDHLSTISFGSHDNPKDSFLNRSFSRGGWMQVNVSLLLNKIQALSLVNFAF